MTTAQRSDSLAESRVQSPAIPRRAFLGMVGLAGLSCGNQHRNHFPTQTADDDTVSQKENLLAKLAPPVAALASKLPNTSDSLKLMEFFVGAEANNRAIYPTLPLVFASDFNRVVKFGYFDTDRQLAVLQDKTYFVSSLNRAILFVLSTHYGANIQSDFITIRDTLDKSFRDVNDFLGDTYKSDWLHVEVNTTGQGNYTTGFNVMLGDRQWKVLHIVVHELVHTVNSLYAPVMPIFVTEGIAEIVAFLLTGQAYYLTTPVKGQVELGITGASTSFDFQAQAAGGLRLFMNIADTIGKPALSRALSKVYVNPSSRGLDLLRAIKEESPEPTETEAIYRRLIADYVPGSA